MIDSRGAVIGPRVLGTETEFGMAIREAEATDPVSNSLQLIGHYPSVPSPHAVWDYENENPLLSVALKLKGNGSVRVLITTAF